MAGRLALGEFRVQGSETKPKTGARGPLHMAGRLALGESLNPKLNRKQEPEDPFTCLADWLLENHPRTNARPKKAANAAGQVQCVEVQFWGY